MNVCAVPVGAALLPTPVTIVNEPLIQQAYEGYDVVVDTMAAPLVCTRVDKIPVMVPAPFDPVPMVIHMPKELVVVPPVPYSILKYSVPMLSVNLYIS